MVFLLPVLQGSIRVLPEPDDIERTAIDLQRAFEARGLRSKTVNPRGGLRMTTTHSRLTQAAAFLAAHGPPLIREYFRADCCIAASKVAYMFMLRLGIRTIPKVTKFTVHTENLWERYQRGEFDGKFHDDEWSVAIGYGLVRDEKHGFDGHLVALAWEGDEKFLIDLSLGQAARPQKGIVIPDGIAVNPGAGFPVTLRLNSCVLRYSEGNNRKYEMSPDWLIGSRTQPIVSELLAHYKVANI